jgi:alcohol dehydrogenase (NADP+)
MPHCSSCAVDLEQYCLKGVTGTYNAASADPGGFTYGGYSKHIVVDEHFVLRMPEGSTPLQQRPCSALASPPIRRSSTGTSKQA